MIFDFFKRKKKVSLESADALPEDRPRFAAAERTAMDEERLQDCRSAVLAMLDARAAEAGRELSEQEALYRRFLLFSECLDAFVFRLKRSDDAFLPIDRWTDEAQGEELDAVFALIDAYNADAAAALDECTMIVPDMVLAGMDLPHPEVLGLPPRGGESIHLSTRGLPYSKSFEVGMEFISDHRTLIRPQRRGLVLESGGRERLLSAELFIIAETVDEFTREKQAAENDEACRFAWAKAVGILGGSPVASRALRSNVQARILTVGRLTVETDAKGRLLPVMLAPKNLRQGAEDFTPLLSREEKEALARYLGSTMPLSGHIPLGNRGYVFLTPEASRVVEALRGLNRGKAEERMTFLANPQRALVELLKDDPKLKGADLDAMVDQVFVETPEFLNERVKALGPWQPKALSFGAPVSNDWFEDGDNRWGFVVNGEYLWATLDELKSLLKKVKKAVASGDEEIKAHGITFPASAVSIPDLTALIEQASRQSGRQFDEAEGGAGKSGAKAGPAEPVVEDAAAVRYGPDIKSNIESLEFAAARTEREAWTHPLQGINGKLMPHQEECLEWLKGLWNQGVPGGLLADDMGLGKTLQCIAFLAWITEGCRRQDLRPRCLVVAPAGLIANWQAEVERWAPGVLGQALVLSGKTLNELKALTASERTDRLDDVVWCIATYEAVRNHIDFFVCEPWTVMVLDEAQKIKNPVSMLTECVKSLETKFTLAMTGTPVENSFMDVWSIIDAAVPGVMGAAKDFSSEWCDDARIEACGRGLHDLLCGGAELEDAEGGKARIRLMLRRMKTEHIRDLPPKMAEPLLRTMPDDQVTAYEDVMAERRAIEENARASMPGLQQLQRLADVSLSPDSLTKKGAVITQKEIERSARLAALFETLDRIRDQREKAVVFVLHLELQQTLARAIKDRYELDHMPGMISGSMSADKRQAVVRSFQDPEKEGRFDVVILTSRAAGTGLTLTAANHVIHLERWWNPAVEDQCSDRCWRIGQKRTVYIHYPLAVLPHANRKSYDQKLDGFLSTKRSRSENILAPASGDDMAKSFVTAMLGDEDD